MISWKRNLLILFAIISFATSGYMAIEGWSFLDSLYMTVITISTIGYREMGELSNAGKIFNMLVILTGVFSAAYILTSTFKHIVDLGLSDYRKGKKMQNLIDKLNQHTIICGHGIMGQKVAKELKQNNIPFVTIESNSESIETLIRDEFLFIHGNAEDDDTLLKAGIKKAKMVISVASTDASNVFITLSAKSLNPAIKVIARALEESSISKLEKAGASKVISPYAQASNSIIQHILNPSIVDFLEVISGHSIDFKMADIEIKNQHRCINKKISEVGAENKQLAIVGLKKANGFFIFAPPKNQLIESGDRLIIMGSGHNFNEQINEMTS